MSFVIYSKTHGVYVKSYISGQWMCTDQKFIYTNEERNDQFEVFPSREDALKFLDSDRDIVEADEIFLLPVITDLPDNKISYNVLIQINSNITEFIKQNIYRYVKIDTKEKNFMRVFCSYDKKLEDQQFFVICDLIQGVYVGIATGIPFWSNCPLENEYGGRGKVFKGLEEAKEFINKTPYIFLNACFVHITPNLPNDEISKEYTNLIMTFLKLNNKWKD